MTMLAIKYFVIEINGQDYESINCCGCKLFSL